MDGPDEPAKLDFRHDELDALECQIFTPFVVHQEKDPAHHLDQEEEERHTPEVVPNGMSMDGNVFFSHKLDEVRKVYPLVDPRIQLLPDRLHVFFEIRTSSS